MLKEQKAEKTNSEPSLVGDFEKQPRFFSKSPKEIAEEYMAAYHKSIKKLREKAKIPDN